MTRLDASDDTTPSRPARPFDVSPPGRGSGSPVSGRAWRVLAVTAVAVFMSFLDVTIVNIAFPDLRADFGSSDLATLSWVLNGYSIVFAAALIPLGRWADRLGRRRVFLAGVVVFVASSAACGLAPSPGWLIAARVVQALGAAALVPTSLALLLPEFPVQRRATATAIWGATGAVAAAAGPSLGGLLVDVGSWRWVFFVNVPIGLAALLPARRLLREASDPATPRPDLLGAGLLALGVGVLSLAILQGPSWGWAGGRVLSCLAAGVALLLAFGIRSSRHRSPVVDLHVFRVRSFAVANAGTFVFALGFYALLLGNVLFLTTAWRYDILLAGAALTPGPLAAAVLAPIGGRLCDRFGPRAVALPGTALFAAGAALLAATVTRDPEYATRFLPATLLTGAGVGLSLSSLSSAAVAELPRTRLSTGSAVMACTRQLGAVVGIAFLLAVLGDGETGPELSRFTTAWWAIAATAVAAFSCAVGLGRIRVPEDPPVPSPTPPEDGGSPAVAGSPSPGRMGADR